MPVNKEKSLISSSCTGWAPFNNPEHNKSFQPTVASVTPVANRLRLLYANLATVAPVGSLSLAAAANS